MVDMTSLFSVCHQLCLSVVRGCLTGNINITSMRTALALMVDVVYVGYVGMQWSVLNGLDEVGRASMVDMMSLFSVCHQLCLSVVRGCLTGNINITSMRTALQLLVDAGYVGYVGM